LPFDPLLITFFEGIIEDKHPYLFIVRQGIQELLETPGAREKCQPILRRLSQSIRAAFNSESKLVIETGYLVLRQLAMVSKDSLVEHINTFLAQICKRIANNLFYDKIITCLNNLEDFCGPDVTKLIKAKIPTYQSVYK
jgi:Parkin co-regulated protein